MIEWLVFGFIFFIWGVTLFFFVCIPVDNMDMKASQPYTSDIYMCILCISYTLLNRLYGGFLFVNNCTAVSDDHRK